MALYVKEYSAKLIFTLDTVRQAQRAQRTIYDSGIVNPNQNTLATNLSPVAGILSTVFLKYPAASLAAGIISIVTSMIQSEKDILKSMVYSGYWNLGYIDDFLVDNPGYDRVEVNLPFIEYTTVGVRFITGKGVVTRVHSGSGWIIM